MEVPAMRKILTIVLMTGMLAVGLGSARQTGQAEVELQAAIRMETVEGNMKGAIEAYKKLADGADRAVAAKALVRLGQCYEKLGDAEAGKAYERVVREFADQKEAVEKARALLAAISRESEPESGIVVEQRWVLPAGAPTAMRQPSPNGRYIPYTNMYRPNRIYLHDFTTGEDRLVLESQEGDAILGAPMISPDGEQIAFTKYTYGGGLHGGHDYELVIAGIDGSKPNVSEKEKMIQPRAWSPDGKLILMTRVRDAEGLSLALLSVSDHSQRELATQGDYSSMCFSPDGRYIAAYRVSIFAGVLPGPLKLIPTDGGKEVVLFESKAKNWPPFWTPDGRQLLFLSDRSGKNDLWSIRVSDGRPEGEPRLVRSDVGLMEPLGFTSDGSFYYKSPNIVQGDIYVAGLDPATGLVISKPERINQRFIGCAGIPAAWSPDGQFLAYTRRTPMEYNRSRVISFIIRSEATGEEREVFPVPADAFNQSFPFPNFVKWFPDGRSLLATDFTEKRQLIFRKVDVETGEVKILLDLSDREKSLFSPCLSADGKTLFYIEGAADYRLMRRDLEGGEEKELYQTKRPAGSIDAISLSADGKQLAFIVSNTGDETESLMILPMGGGNPRELLRSKMSIAHVAWTKDNRHVLMQGYSGSGPYRVWAISIEGGEPQPSEHATNLGDVHPDGSRIVFSARTGGNEEVWVFRNLLSQPNK
jgi:Tol biopolymer transport system component